MAPDFPSEIAPLYSQGTPQQQASLKTLRELVFEIAEGNEKVGHIEEASKWGQASFLTVKPKSGSTIRVAPLEAEPDKVGLYFICHTGLVEEFVELYPETFNSDGKRSIYLSVDQDWPLEELKHIIALALTYHKRR